MDVRDGRTIGGSARTVGGHRLGPMVLRPDPTGDVRRRRPRGHLAAALAVVAVAVLLAPLPAAAAEPTASPTPSATTGPSPAPTGSPAPARVPSATLAPAASPSPVASLAGAAYQRAAPAATLSVAASPLPTRVLIYRDTAMVKQYTNYWCVPATTQSMVNLILGTSDRTKATQQRYYTGIRAHNRYSYSTKGNDPQGWAWGLRTYSGNTTTYQGRSFTNKTAALDAIVESIDRTGTPVAVTVHDGTHAWIVLGYKAQLDPADPSKRTILGFYVSGPLGAPTDPWPYAYMTTSTFRQHFTRYHEWQRSVIWEGTWVIISQ
jgi:hypothetical protein